MTGPAATKTSAIPTRKYFAHLQTAEVDSFSTAAEESSQQPTAVSNEVGRTPPVIITTSINLLKFQRELKSLMKGTFEFRTTRDGIMTVTKDMADYSALMRHIDASKIPYYTFHPKSLKLV